MKKKAMSISIGLVLFFSLTMILLLRFKNEIQAPSPKPDVMSETSSPLGEKSLSGKKESETKAKEFPSMVDTQGFHSESEKYVTALLDVLNGNYADKYPYNLHASLVEQTRDEGFETYTIEISGRSFLLTFSNAGANTSFAQQDSDTTFDLITLMEVVETDQDIYLLVGASEACVILDSPDTQYDMAASFCIDLLDAGGNWLRQPPFEYSINAIHSDDNTRSVLLFAAREITPFSQPET